MFSFLMNIPNQAICIINNASKLVAGEKTVSHYFVNTAIYEVKYEQMSSLCRSQVNRR